MCVSKVGGGVVGNRGGVGEVVAGGVVMVVEVVEW